MLFEDEPTHNCLMWVLRRVLSRRKVEGENEERKSERERERERERESETYRRQKQIIRKRK